MKKNLIVSIPEPCSENWNAMQSQGSGRFCNTCKKTVVDFTQFVDEELIVFFEKTPPACGRLTRQQLDQLQSPPSTPSFFNKPGKYITSLLMAILGMTSKAPAQESNAPLIHSNPATSRQSGQQEKTTDTIATREITGQILDEQGAPVTAAAVFIPGMTRSTISDLDGNFRILYPEHLIANNTVHLRISVVGYEEANSNFLIMNENRLRVLLHSTEQELMGDIVIVRKPTLWQQLTKPFRKKR